jgi:hypothetical protein
VATLVRARARNGLARHSLNNQLLIALQCPQATYVCGLRAWLELDYCVRKDERAIRILAPMKVRLADDDPAASVARRSPRVQIRGRHPPPWHARLRYGRAREV